MVAFRLHLPARIRYHNAPTRRVERGNILEWEQSLTDRLKGEPVHIEARMDQESILYSTLTLFGLMALLVAMTFVVIIWWVVRKGRREAGVSRTNARKAELKFGPTSVGAHLAHPAHPAHLAHPYSFSSRSFISASVLRSFFTENAPNVVASDRASIRSTLFCTTPVSVTRPFCTTM